LSADRIASDLNPEHPEAAKIQAGKTFIRRLERTIAENENVVVESTLAGKGIGRFLKRFQEAGYTVENAFLFLETPEACIRRVRERVRRGGHDVPRDDIVRRFYRNAINFWDQYRYQVDRWYLFSNAGDQFREVAFGTDARYTVTDEDNFDLFLQIISEANE
jgi:predicted ABC-type ATPase